MPYITVAEARAGGVAVPTDDAELQEILNQQEAFINAATGCVFEPTSRVFKLDGRGREFLILPLPLIEVTKVEYEDDAGNWIDVPVSNFKWYVGEEYIYEPRIFWRKNAIRNKFEEGHINWRVTATVGWVEYDVNGDPIVPPMIKNLLTMLAGLANGNRYGSPEHIAESLRRLIKSESTDGHSYSLGELDKGDREAKPTGMLTGNEEIDGVLMEYYYEPLVVEAL